MKKKNYLILAFALISFISCSKEDICTVCTEATTGVTSEYCESESLVEIFESELIEQGNSAGQSWSCVRQ